MFRALVMEKQGDAPAVAALRELDESALPDGDVTVAVEYSTLNYKDGLCLSGNGGGVVRAWPHVPGIDFSGSVLASDDARYKAGDKVVLTGWRVGEVHWGGYAQKARVKADWLVPLPAGLTTRQAMAVGTAGLTAMLAIQALEDHGLTPEKGEVLVTGAAGGVGSIAVALLAAMGYQVAAVTGRPETEGYLRNLGAQRIVPRAELAETVKRPLETETWAGCVDAVGGRCWRGCWANCAMAPRQRRSVWRAVPRCRPRSFRFFCAGSTFWGSTVCRNPMLTGSAPGTGSPPIFRWTSLKR
jgi:acrylyl-CoA reductase (NADPH)